jgi:hypothetical protein
MPKRKYKKDKDVAISEDKVEKPRKIHKYMKPIKQARKIKVLDELPKQPSRDFSERISKIRLRKKREEIKPLTQEEAFRYDQILAQLEKSKEPEKYQKAMEQSMAMSGMDKEEEEQEPQEQEPQEEQQARRRMGRPRGTKKTMAEYKVLLKKAGKKVSGSAAEVRDRYERYLQEQEKPMMRPRSASPPLYTKKQKKQQKKKLKKQQKKQQKMMEEAESNLQQAPAEAPAETPEITQARNQAIENAIQFFMANQGITRNEAEQAAIEDITSGNPQTEQDYNDIGSGYLGSGLTKKRAGTLVKKVMKHHQGQLKKIKKHLGRDLEKKDIKKLQKAKFFGGKLNGAGFTDTLLDLGKKGLKAAVDYGIKNPDKVLGYAKKGFEMGKSILDKKKKKGGVLQKTSSVFDVLRNQ